MTSSPVSHIRKPDSIRSVTYYFLDNDGSIKAYWPSRDEPDSQIPCISTDIKSKRNSIILRGFTTITFIE